ncbi:sulfatase/phosphatase domain-containing protein [Amycolatopsis halotolerans]|uniref:Sulfatase/phosphatase domain-containing protein n=1 Tax=Amycolatopsis halotolerans TaxID=330083 RepID=A0ABV7QAY0_9PSEU
MRSPAGTRNSAGCAPESRLGLTGDIAVIVSADHGESLGELGLYAGHGLASEPVQRLPLIVFWPGITDGDIHRRRNEALLCHIDYAPTICDLLGFELPAKWQGVSFADAVRGKEIESRDYLVWGQGAHTYQRAVRTLLRLAQSVRWTGPQRFREVRSRRALSANLSGRRGQPPVDIGADLINDA